LKKIAFFGISIDVQTIMMIVIMALVYFLTGILSLYYTMDNMIVTISFFFPEGFALAGVLLFGKRIIPGIFLGQFILAIHQGFTWEPSLLIACSNSLEALIAYYLLRKIDFDIHLYRIEDVYKLILVIVFVLQPFSAFGGTFSLYVFEIIGKEDVLKVFFSWWFGNILGQLLLTPLLLLLYYRYKTLNYVKMLAVSLALGTICYIFMDIAPIENSSILFSITIVPLVLSLSFRNGVVYALFSIIVIALIAINSANQHIGIFSVYNDMTNLINLNFYILVHILIVLIIGILFVEKNRALHELSALNMSLESKIKLEVEKNRQKDRLMFFQARLAKMGEVISLIIHQWKQPLNNLSLINQSFYLNYKRGRITEKSVEKFYADTKTQIAEMSKIAEDYKEFFKPDRKKQRFCINEIVAHIIDLITPMLDHAEIDLIAKCPEKVYVEGYPNEFGQAVLNIMHNARDALQKNKKVLQKQITIMLEENEKYIILTIQDNGGGIPHEVIDRIFEPYFTTKEESEGTGLGLYMTRIIIEEYMGGMISVSNDSEGAVFEIILKKL